MGKAFRLTAALILVSMLAGCATNEAARNLHNYAATERPRAQSGAIKWSEYYRGAYSLAIAANAPGDALGRLNESIRNSELYESGAIDKSQFEYRQRAIASAQKAQEDMNAQEEQARRTAQLAAAAQILQASGPHTLEQPSVSPAGIMGMLQSQSANGTLRYCRYSNGVVTTISIVSLCPLNTQ